MNQTDYVRQGANASKKFVAYVNPAFPEPDTHTVFYADHNPVEVHREPGETTPDFFGRVVAIVEEMRAEIMADNQVNYGNYRKLLERQWRYQFAHANIYGGTLAECSEAFYRSEIIRCLKTVIDAPDAEAKTKLKAIDVLMQVCDIGQAHETAR